ncbi:MAG: S1C family serine protease [Verrucomicrobiae bacterium]|nr:S1C family serine protease [Verrucomicrobiae bacterium]NNJ44193.1 serine protease [Akkermansiaceae bacterium]
MNKKTRFSTVSLAVLTLLGALHFSISALQAQSVNFAALGSKGGKASASSCVLIDDKGTLATVVELGSDLQNATLVAGGKNVPLKYVVSDADSRVALYQIPVASIGLIQNPIVLGSSLSLKPSQAVYTSATDRSVTARVVSREHRFQGKTLPLAVLRVNHAQDAPLPGSGIYDDEGKLVGLVRQAVHHAPSSSYCLPAEVVSRIRSDHERNGKVSRCWIGIIMDEWVAAPMVESVRPGSPAQRAGLKKGDVILSIGDRSVRNYTEVVDAFYYLVAGESAKFRVLRGTEMKAFDVKPEVSPRS